ncbi:hypothetical protein P3342_010046 [Pyrenophora teres f. teres]|nr:hypothetical protein P3342_010046 [Pyrenophora teres f. teres]
MTCGPTTCAGHEPWIMMRSCPHVCDSILAAPEALYQFRLFGFVLGRFGRPPFDRLQWSGLKNWKSKFTTPILSVAHMHSSPSGPCGVETRPNRRGTRQELLFASAMRCSVLLFHKKHKSKQNQLMPAQLTLAGPAARPLSPTTTSSCIDRRIAQCITTAQHPPSEFGPKSASETQNWVFHVKIATLGIARADWCRSSSSYQFIGTKGNYR